MSNPCITCGACCAFFRVSFYWGESGTGPGLVPSDKVEKLSDHRVCMAGTDRKPPRCVCLGGTIGVDVGCTIYNVRPSPCREFQASWSDGTRNPDCDRARAAFGLPPVDPRSGEEGQLPRDAAAILLAGGRSARMGRDKRFLEIGGVPMVEHVYRQLEPEFSEVILSVSDDKVTIPGRRQVKDAYPGAGPLGGIVSALEASTRDVNFVVACDIPFIPLELVHRLLDEAPNHDAVVPVDALGRFEPLFAVYSKRLLPVLKNLVFSGEKRTSKVFDLVDTHQVELPEGVDLRNLNTESDYLEYLSAGIRSKQGSSGDN